MLKGVPALGGTGVGWAAGWRGGCRAGLAHLEGLAGARARVPRARAGAGSSPAGGALWEPGDMVKGAHCAAACVAPRACKASRGRIRTKRTKHLYLAAEATEGAGGLELPILCRPRK